MQAPETLQTCQQRGKLGIAADEDTHKASHLSHMCTGVPNSRLPSGKTNMGNADFQEARALDDIHVHAVGEDGLMFPRLLCQLPGCLWTQALPPRTSAQGILGNGVSDWGLWQTLGNAEMEASVGSCWELQTVQPLRKNLAAP